MTAAPQRISIQEYLAMERRSETKHEYFAGQIYAMAGASYAHTLIAANATRALGNLLENTNCNAVASDLRIRTLTGLYTYPDVVVVCGKPEFDDQEGDTLLNPVAIIEVLSRSTEAYDRGQKFKNYQSIPSLKEYVLVSQSRMSVDHFARQSEGNWTFATYSTADDKVVFRSLNVSVPISRFYLKVELPSAPSLKDDGTES